MNILLVCTGNTCRSPMAAGLLSLGTGALHNVGSAGIHAVPGMPASNHAITVMAGYGLDISSHKARRLSEDMVGEADLILTMTESHKAAVLAAFPSAVDKVHTLGEFAGTGGEITDPYGGTLADYRASAADILARIPGIASRIAPSE